MAGAGYVGADLRPGGPGRVRGDDLATCSAGPAPRTRRVAGTPGACHDLEDVVRWFAGHRVVAARRHGIPVRGPAGPAEEPANPVAADPRPSRGSASPGTRWAARRVLSYLRGLAAGRRHRRAAPPGAARRRSRSPTPRRCARSCPCSSRRRTTTGSPSGSRCSRRTPAGWARASATRSTRSATTRCAPRRERRALSLIVLEGGTHTDFIDQPFILRDAVGEPRGRPLPAGVDGLPRPRSCVRVRARPSRHPPPVPLVRQRGRPRRRRPGPEPVHLGPRPVVARPGARRAWPRRSPAWRRYDCVEPPSGRGPSGRGSPGLGPPRGRALSSA